jgi:hypothetical protein
VALHREAMKTTMTTNRNMTPEDAATDLEAALQMALHDALKSTDKPTAALLEVCRKVCEDQRAHKRWTVEQQALLANAAPASTALAGSAPALDATGEAPTPTPTPAPVVVQGVDLSRLPFPSVKRRGVEYPPTKVGTTDEADERKSWDRGLNSVPFMAPE